MSDTHEGRCQVCGKPELDAEGEWQNRYRVAHDPNNRIGHAFVPEPVAAPTEPPMLCQVCGLPVVWEPNLIGGADWRHIDWPQDHAPVTDAPSVCPTCSGRLTATVSDREGFPSLVLGCDLCQRIVWPEPVESDHVQPEDAFPPIGDEGTPFDPSMMRIFAAAAPTEAKSGQDDDKQALADESTRAYHRWRSEQVASALHSGWSEIAFRAGYERAAAIPTRLRDLEEGLRRIAETTVISGYGAFVPDGDDALDVRAFAHAVLSSLPTPAQEDTNAE